MQRAEEPTLRIAASNQRLNSTVSLREQQYLEEDWKTTVDWTVDKQTLNIERLTNYHKTGLPLRQSLRSEAA